MTTANENHAPESALVASQSSISLMRKKTEKWASSCQTPTKKSDILNESGHLFPTNLEKLSAMKNRGKRDNKSMNKSPTIRVNRSRSGSRTSSKLKIKEPSRSTSNYLRTTKEDIQIESELLTYLLNQITMKMRKMRGNMHKITQKEGRS